MSSTKDVTVDVPFWRQQCQLLRTDVKLVKPKPRCKPPNLVAAVNPPFANSSKAAVAKTKRCDQTLGSHSFPKKKPFFSLARNLSQILILNVLFEAPKNPKKLKQSRFHTGQLGIT